MNRRLALAVGIGLVFLSVPVSAQSRESVVDRYGRPTGEWKAREVCVAPGKCAKAIISAETGEVAMYDSAVTNGFDRTGDGDQIVRGSAIKPSKTPTKPDENRVLDENGQLVAPWIELTCKGRTPCPRVIVHSKSREIAMLDGKWSPTFRPTGKGKEVKRIPAPIRSIVR